MPTVSVNREVLFSVLQRNYSEDEFDTLCFEFGLELDDVKQDESDETIYKIEVAANRHDLLCVEGIARALSVFTGISNIPNFTALLVDDPQVLIVKPETTQIRPYVVGAVLRNIKFDQHSFRSFIDLQDKLHHNIGRHRTLVSIGTHDLDTIEGPFFYNALPPKEINFIPLKQDTMMDGDEIMKFYEQDMQLKEFLHIIKDSPVYPIIYDKNDTVLSLPPIINGEHSKVTLETRNLFIECTALDLAKAKVAVDTLVAMFSEHCTPQFTYEPILIRYEAGHAIKGGQEEYHPALQCKQVEVSLDFVRQTTGIMDLTIEDCSRLLKKMMITSEVKIGKNKLTAQIPINRHDILHQCDLAEDIAIAYGFNNIAIESFPAVGEVSLNAFGNQIRNCIAMNGYLECLNWGLCSMKDAFDYLLQPYDSKAAFKTPALEEYTREVAPVKLLAPKTKEFEIVRTTLIPGLLKTLHANKGKELPIRLFEIGDTAFLDKSFENGSRNKRHYCALYANRGSSGLEEVHGLIDSVLERFRIYASYTIAEKDKNIRGYEEHRPFYSLIPSEDPAFLPARQVHIHLQPMGVNIGVMGVLHPHVLKTYGITMPVSLAEVNIEGLLPFIDESEIYED